MEVLHVLILGIVEGVTEFLPISSTGHLVLAERLLGLEPTAFVSTFTIAIQLGAILAVPTLFWRQLTRSWAFIARLVVAFIPTAILGLACYPFVKQLLGGQAVILWALALGGVAMILLERYVFKGREGSDDIAELPYRNAAFIGLFQALALVPGVSRAAATIFGGLFAGLSRTAAVRFSFLLALPTMAAATGLDVYRSLPSLTGGHVGVLLSGGVIAWVTAMMAMRWLVRYLQYHDFAVFGYYRIAIALLFWLLVY